MRFITPPNPLIIIQTLRAFRRTTTMKGSVGHEIFFSIFANVFATDFLGHGIPKCLQKPSGRVLGASPGPPRTVPEHLRTDSRNNFERITPNVPIISCEIGTFGMILGPGRSPRIIKNPTF